MDNGASSYRRFLNGEESGFVEIIRDYKDGLIFYLNGFVGNIHTAEELAEDTFVKIITKKPRFAGKSSFKTWLYAIGRNVALNYIKKHARTPETSIDDYSESICDEENLEQSYICEERKIIIHRAMRNIKKEYRQILWLIYFENLSNKEASIIMKKSVHNIETLVYRARKSLKEELIKEGFTYEELQ
ncbi:MAG: RNA polymerase sigma factor [Eubacterium sp.]|nr:RNA polymerase sigma factor [Eubacterium sp.]